LSVISGVIFCTGFRWRIEKEKAASGLEPENRGFADLCLTTWLSRLEIRRSGGKGKPVASFLIPFRAHPTSE
jgi:hypothetical protein